MDIRNISSTTIPSSQNTAPQKSFSIEKRDINNFALGTVLSYGLLETADKYSLLRNKRNKTPKALKIAARLNTFKNIFKGAIGGVVIAVVCKYLAPSLEPLNPRINSEIQRQGQIMRDTFNFAKAQEQNK